MMTSSNVMYWLYIALLVTQIASFKQIPKFGSTYNKIRLCMSTKVSGSETQTPPPTATAGATVLKCDKLTKAYTGVPQFDEISFALGKGQRVGLIGINGAGKTTFMKCLARVDSPDSGTVEALSSANIVFVEQDPKWQGTAVYEALFSEDSNRARAAKKYMAACNPIPDINADENALVESIEAMDASDAWEYQEKGLSLAEKLNIFSEDLYRPMSSLSGGQKKRVALAAALLLQPDVLLLDEPTNHLDIDALDWLADYLRPGGVKENKEMAILMVTHDRFFLERVCSEIVELDRGSIYRYPCNYGKYLELKSARLAAEDAETERARTKLRRESEWMSRQPKARQAKSRARENAFYELVDKAKGRSPDAKALELATPEEKAKQKRLGGIVGQFRNAGYTLYNTETGTTMKLLDDFTYELRQRDRIGIVGPNGVGKSTFLKILSGQLQLETGNMKIGDTVKIGYYEQIGLQLTPEQEKMPVLKFVQEECEKASDKKFSSGDNTPKIAISMEDPSSMGRRKQLAGKEASVSVEIVSQSSDTTAFSEREAMNLLQRFQFPSKRFYDRIGQLSGGERRRLQLLQILASKPNVLLLDEPSNDLDLNTLSALEEYLTEVFEGCLIVVSHDNFFVNRVAEHLFVFQGDGIVRDFQGSYTEYLEYRKDYQLELQAATKAANQKNKETSSTSSSSSSSSSGSSNSNSKTTTSTTTTTMSASTTETKEKKQTPKVDNKSKTIIDNVPKRELTYAERKEMNKLEKEISKLSAQIVDLEAEIVEKSNQKVGFSVLAEISKKVETIKVQIADKEMKWLEYAEIAGDV